MRLYWLAVFVALLSGCSMPYRVPVFAATDGNSTDFNGIADVLKRDQPLDVLLVHGMCTHDADWAKGAVQQLYASLGGDAEAVQLERRTVDGTKIELYQQTLSLSNGKLRANAILWSPLTTPLKGQLCYDQTNKSSTCPPVEAAKNYPYQRAKLNRELKDVILNDCLSDAVIYQGKARDDINAQMQKAILQATATSGGLPSSRDFTLETAEIPLGIHLVVVTDSLGSKITFDAVNKLIANPETTNAGERIVDRTTQIFMAANQLPILALADQNLDGTIAAFDARTGYPADPLEALMRRRSLRPSELHAAPPPQVVAFTDPNDLLSYILVPRPQTATTYPVVDVVVSNAATYFGLAALPNEAHLGYHTNVRVGELIACGHPKKSGVCTR